MKIFKVEKKKGFLRLSLKASKGGTGFQCLKEVDALSFLWLCKEEIGWLL